MKTSKYNFIVCERCKEYEAVFIGNSVTSIDERAFYDCSSLTGVTFKNPNGWWFSSSSTATSGASISSAYLEDTSTAATYLTSTRNYYYWFRD